MSLCAICAICAKGFGGLPPVYEERPTGPGFTSVTWVYCAKCWKELTALAQAPSRGERNTAAEYGVME